MAEIDNIIAKVLSGEATDTELILFNKWMESDPEHHHRFLQMKSYWGADVTFNHPISLESSFEKLSGKIRQQEAELRQKTQKRKIIYIGATIASLAACLITFVLLPGGLGGGKDSLLYYEFKTTTQIDTITLPDHSKVILNKHSRLTYSEEFHQKNRNVRLEGEALFDIAKDKNNPFTIILDDENRVTVLGTTFNVSSRHSEENINVTLFTGSVKFENEKNKVVLSPNQELTFNRNTRNVEVVESDPEFALFWLTGVYKYQSLSMRRLANTLSKIFGVEIKLDNHELENVKVSGAFYNGQTIEEVLYRISRSLKIDWIIKDNKIIIH